MRLKSFSVENVRSYGKAETLSTDEPISLIIGPNGGGKTNLFDALATVVRRFIIAGRSIAGSTPQDGRPMRELQVNNEVQTLQLEKHNLLADHDQELILDIEVTASDVRAMELIYASREKMAEFASNLKGWNYKFCLDWEMALPPVSYIVRIRVKNGDLSWDSTDIYANKFVNFIKNYEVDSLLREESGEPQIAFPIVYLPTNRAQSGMPDRVELHNFDLHNLKRTAEAASSKTQNSSFPYLAIGRLIRLHRMLVDRENGSKAQYDKLPEVQGVTRELKRLGYTWSIVCTDIVRNAYTVEIKKKGKAFRIDQASSGERELLSYVFAIYGLGIRDALILIDEPELHLHPEWQGVLLDMFRRLATETGNQFILATHSPRLVTPSSIRGVSRVYSDGEFSHIQRLNAVQLPQRKHLFSIVNSQNNERIFFADCVLLVEGQADRIFFESALRELKLSYATGVLEIVAVGRKTLFEVYSGLLSALNIRSFLIADRDYLKQVGSNNVKSLFHVDLAKVRQDVVFNGKSYDGEKIIRVMDEAISSGEWTEPRELWEYIKSTRLGSLAKLTKQQYAALESDINDQATSGKFILRQGELEDYLPAGYRAKDLEKLISLTAREGYWTNLPETGRLEVEGILKAICY